MFVDVRGLLLRGSLDVKTHSRGNAAKVCPRVIKRSTSNVSPSTIT